MLEWTTVDGWADETENDLVDGTAFFEVAYSADEKADGKVAMMAV